MRYLGFAICGPLIPIIALYVIFALGMGNDKNLMYVLFTFGYLVGIVPSIFASILFRYLKLADWKDIRTRPNFILGAISGAAPGLAGAAWLIFGTTGSNLTVAIYFFVMCVFAGSVCGQVFGSRGCVPEKLNND